VLYLGLHRNGAVDGFVYDSVLRDPTFLISTQLRRNLFARLFFNGIVLARRQDEGDPSANQDSLRDCLNLLRAGGELFIFPEGTSSLGPRHLPFKSGAAHLLLDYLESTRRPICVVPLGIHYGCPWGFQSKVEVVVGQPIETSLSPGETRLQRLRTIKHRISAALQEVGVNVVSDEYQHMIQRFACMAADGTGRSCFKSLKRFERAVPSPLLDTWSSLAGDVATRRLLRHEEVPFMPLGPVAGYAIALLSLAPVVLLGIAANLPPLLAAWWAGRTLPDDRNVISLWKILIGVPALVLWFGAVVVIAVVFQQWLLLAAYAGLTWAGLKLYHRVKKLAVVVSNGLRHPQLCARLRSFRKTLLGALADEKD
jgi:1-acyl-sn-glycerol-3-phosphate acyltransferase